MAKEETILGKVLGLLTRMISSKLVLNDLARAEIYEITNYALSHIPAGQARQELRKRREEAFGRLDEVRADAELQAEMVAKILAKVVR